MKNKLIFFVVLFGLSVCSYVCMAQTVNKGKLYIKPGSIVSTLYVFENKEKGDFRNNGTFYVYNSLINNGSFFDFKGSIPQGKIIFSGNKRQLIEGKSFMQVNDLEFDNTTLQKAFDISTTIAVKGNVDFTNGIGVLNNEMGSFTFLEDATASNVSDKSHLEGEMEKVGNADFVFPQGDKGLYRPAKIVFASKNKDMFVSEYRLRDAPFFQVHKNKASIINQVDTAEYWIVEHSQKGKGSIVLTLSWNERTTPQTLLDGQMDDLHIIRWDEVQNMWVDEGGIVDINTKTVTTPTEVKGYGVFTLGTVKAQMYQPGDIVIYNLVSANEDGQNDYFLIDNIQKYPNNKVEIFNRWGVKVFETNNYDTTGNVFKGFSDGRVTVNRGEKLPSGTYYYIVNYELKDKNGSQLIKKAGYLHLEAD